MPLIFDSFLVYFAFDEVSCRKISGLYSLHSEKRKQEKKRKKRSQVSVLIVVGALCGHCQEIYVFCLPGSFNFTFLFTHLQIDRDVSHKPIES